MINKRHLPAIPDQKKSSSSFGGTHAAWVRLSAFLSLRAPNTQDTYLAILRQWCCFLKVDFGSAKGAETILRATDLHAVAYRNWLEKQPGERPRSQRKSSSLQRSIEIQHSTRKQKKEGLESTLSNATIAKKFAALRRMYRVLIAADLGLTTNPFDTDRVPAPAKDSGRKRPTEMIDFTLVKKIISLPDTKSPKGLRDQAILSVLFGGALRRSEAAKLRIGDVKKSTRGTVFLYLRATKAKRDAQQALPPWCASVIAKLLAQRRTEGADETGYLFISYTGRGGKSLTRSPVSASGIYKLFKYYCQLAGAGDFVTPHSARATAITRLLDEGIPHRQVQEFSRHSSVQMVELYDKRRIGVDENAAKDLDFD